MNADPGQEFRKWGQLGPEAVPILINAARYRDGAVERVYPAIWKKLPGPVQKRLPVPVDYSPFRLAALARLTMPDIRIEASQYPIVLPILNRGLTDTNFFVRANAMNVLYEKLFPYMAGPQKQAYIPRIVLATQDTNTSVRMIAAYCLRSFSNRTDAVYPALKLAMQDREPDVRIRAAMAAYYLDPSAGSNSDHALDVAYDCLGLETVHGAGAMAEVFLKEIGKYDDRPLPRPDRALR
jgi:hypothetical protein